MKYVFLILIASMSINCSSSEENLVPSDNALKTIIGYQNKLQWFNNDNSSEKSFVLTTGVLRDGKLIEEVDEVFDGDQSIKKYIKSSYKYNNNLLIENSNKDRKYNYYYDFESKLIGITLEIKGENNQSSILYYRVIYKSINTIYLEKLSLPQDDVNTKIIKRNISVWQGNNIVKAGVDDNLDDIMDKVNEYEYANGNLIKEKIILNDGKVLEKNHEFSNVLDTSKLILDNSLGEKNRKIICIETFAFNADFFKLHDQYSKNISLEEYEKHTFEILSNNYYFKSIFSGIDDYTYPQPKKYTYTTEYYFR